MIEIKIKDQCYHNHIRRSESGVYCLDCATVIATFVIGKPRPR